MRVLRDQPLVRVVLLPADVPGVMIAYEDIPRSHRLPIWPISLPISRRNNRTACKIEWRPAAYHTVLQILRHPVYAGAYVFGRTTQHTRIVDGRARKATGHTQAKRCSLPGSILLPAHTEVFSVGHA